jgi:transcriptional regulator with XRE-family HTH domain
MGGLMSNIPQLVLEKKARDGRDYKNKQIADELNLSESMVSRFLRDMVDIETMNFGTALRWADWLGCEDVRELVRRSKIEN